MMVADDDIAAAARALSEPVRLRVPRLLPPEHQCDEMYNVSELAEEFGMAQPVVSRHLAVLKRAGLVTSERTCQSVHYAINKDRTTVVLAALTRVL
jgi:DNA-binding transcriptional ArsR family regulator